MTVLKIVEKLLVGAKPVLKNNTCIIYCEKDNVSFFIAVDTIDFSIINISLFDDKKQIFISEEVKKFALNVIKLNIEKSAVKTYPAIIFCEIYALSEKEAEIILDNIVTEMKITYDNNPSGKMIKDEFLHLENYTCNPSLN